MGILELLLRTYHTYYVSDSLTGFSAFFRESFHVAAAAHLCLFITSYQTSWQSSSLFWVSIVVLHRYTSVPRLFAFLERKLPTVSVFRAAEDVQAHLMAISTSICLFWSITRTLYYDLVHFPIISDPFWRFPKALICLLAFVEVASLWRCPRLLPA